jgi:hypothetical protein
MLPKTVHCEQCDQKAKVCGYGRVEYDWPESDDPAATPEIRCVRLIVDCPHCGLFDQDHFPNGPRAATRPAGSSKFGRRAALLSRLQSISAALRSSAAT